MDHYLILGQLIHPGIITTFHQIKGLIGIKWIGNVLPIPIISNRLTIGRMVSSHSTIDQITNHLLIITGQHLEMELSHNFKLNTSAVSTSRCKWNDRMHSQWNKYIVYNLYFELSKQYDLLKLIHLINSKKCIGWFSYWTWHLLIDFPCVNITIDTF